MSDVWFKSNDGTNVSIHDKKYFVEKPDKDFSPERNQRIIKKTIEDAHRREALAFKRIQEELGERAEAVAYFLTSRRVQGNRVTTKQMVNYFGKPQLVSLAGERILSKAKKLAEYKRATP